MIYKSHLIFLIFGKLLKEFNALIKIFLRVKYQLIYPMIMKIVVKIPLKYAIYMKKLEAELWFKMLLKVYIKKF